MRAQTAQAKFQVELAQYQYLYPRLTRMWSHLSKQKGGVGMRGPGEKELETDRRIVKDRISFLKEKLKVVDLQSETRRKGRDRMVRVALVGYTNVGKSTLLNLLTKADVLAENKLFATVDATVRKVVYKEVPFLLTDTVGFIRKLPHHLIESFKSTLDEVREADVLVHVVDISHPWFEQQADTVMKTMASIDKHASEKPVLFVFNKIDQIPKPQPGDEDALLPMESAMPTLDFLKETWLSKQGNSAVFISATDRTNIDQLREEIYQLVLKKHLLIYPNFLKTTVYQGNSEWANQETVQAVEE